MAMGFMGGMSSKKLPSTLSDESILKIGNSKIEGSVGVKVHTAPVYSNKLVKVLSSINLFERVDSLDSFESPPTYIVEVHRHIYGTPTIPIFTLITFGSIPTILREDEGYSFFIYKSETPEQKIEIEYINTSTSVLGSISALLNLFPDWSSRDESGHERVRQYLTLEILNKIGKTNAKL